tara:strand:- start:228 stop:494 length:267 start_codon:yes stop_codon:yes gene_type:complete
MGDPIWFCDVILRDPKLRKDYKIRDTLVSGNDKDRIWNYPLYRERLVREVFTTPARYKKAMQNRNLFIKHINFKVQLGYSNVDRGLTV